MVGWLEVIYGNGVGSASTPAGTLPRSPSPILPHPEDRTPDHSLEVTPARDRSTLSTAVTPGTTTPGLISVDSPVGAHKGRLYHYLYTVYADIRIDQLFNIIVEFPDSEPALTDLSTCLEKTDRRSKLVVMLKNALETRLLHPGKLTRHKEVSFILFLSHQ